MPPSQTQTPAVAAGSPSAPPADDETIALMSGGRSRAVLSAAAALAQGGHARVDSATDTITAVGASPPGDASELAKALWKRANGQGGFNTRHDLDTFLKEQAPRFESRHAVLAARSLVHTTGPVPVSVPRLALIVFGTVGLALLLPGLGQGTPMDDLAFWTLLVALFVIPITISIRQGMSPRRNRPRLTSAGRNYLASLKQGYPKNAVNDDRLTLWVALYGPSALAGTALAELAAIQWGQHARGTGKSVFADAEVGGCGDGGTGGCGGGGG